MKFLGFYPETVAARVRAAAAPPRLLTLGQSLGFGAGGFCLVIVIVMAVTTCVNALLRRLPAAAAEQAQWGVGGG